MDDKELKIALGMLSTGELADLEKLLSHPEVEALARDERAKARRDPAEEEPKCYLVH